MSLVIRERSQIFERFFVPGKIVYRNSPEFRPIPPPAFPITTTIPLSPIISFWIPSSVFDFLISCFSHVVSTAIPCPSTITLFKTGDADSPPTRHDQVVARRDPTIRERRYNSNWITRCISTQESRVGKSIRVGQECERYRDQQWRRISRTNQRRVINRDRTHRTGISFTRLVQASTCR